MTKPDPADTMFLSPDDTIRVWEERTGLRTSVHYTDTQHGEHAAWFTVAKIAKLDLLNSMRASLDPVLRSGGTFADWKRDILPQLQAAGWWGLVQDEALTGTPDPVMINNRRLQTIYRTNVRMSIAAGRWRKYQREKDLFPYLRYVSNHYRKHPRADHQSWHGLILPIDDPAWQWMFPPNGWGCRCQAQQVSETELKRKGWGVGKAPNPPMIRYETPNGPMFAPEGIAQGFAYNPGTAHLQVLADRLSAELGRALDNGLEQAARTILSELLSEPSLEQFLAIPKARMPLAILGAEEAAMIGAGNRVATLTDDAVLAASQRLPVAVWRQVETITERFTMRGREGDNTLIYVLDQGDNTYLFVRMVRTAPDANLAIRDTSIEPAEGIDALFADATDIIDRRASA